MNKEPPRVFIDTNVWFSFLYGSPNCQKLINAHAKGKIKAFMSRQVLEETVRNLKEKIPHTIPVFEQFIKSSPPTIIKDPKSVSRKISDLVSEEDKFIIGSALRAKVKYFITGNIKDFKKNELEEKFGIEILTPREAVEKFSL
ncbi:putative toxin-antitoxin system toxin component, PIN family [Candidatus Woesebacteria bacterium RIFCSPHIGHO2_01_FULL_38_9]|uniref:Putative toxin-antitoxin system toxin component, PIN family n=2 Tax=Candidatus Woeseibacteriota TaxID=1752722 RepID=A0A1F7XZI3_9BACT|nr:MAG: putative toxin-antitoxin system toxin component, PIN family [Candidatus Woesebacteria bacterium RIFCSPHIGHO2_01_FULL_38_9]OGM58599.1 MAG: putative toxin-antitoxin system toxin component, PIN family [Candidatus Woesebacteria bacterium RIFCSPLOWO2_01_FULL_39_10]